MDLKELYIDLIKKSLLDYIDMNNHPDHDVYEGAGLYPSDKSKSMIGYKSFNNIENCIRDIVNNNIDGDFIETGVWRGGQLFL